MRHMITPFAVLTGGPALAHTGHLGLLDGHDHWVAGLAIGAAVVVGVVGALKGRKTDPGPPQAEDAPDAETEEPA
jgi:hypothetical protein